MVKFFDALTGVAQMVIFFLLGLLVTPKELPQVFLPAILIFLFMTFIGRPAVVSVILAPFKASIKQIGVVSWAGFRGVASIVFSIYAVLAGIPMEYNLFNLVFVIVIVSLAVQGALLPAVSKDVYKKQKGCFPPGRLYPELPVVRFPRCWQFPPETGPRYNSCLLYTSRCV